MKKAEIEVGRKYARHGVRGKTHVREVTAIEGKMVVFRKHYGDKGMDEVTITTFARWAEEKVREDEAFIQEARGLMLDTPTKIEVRVFHTSDPGYTYHFVRKEGRRAVLVDDHNGSREGSQRIVSFPVDELVNVGVLKGLRLKAATTPLPSPEDS